MELEFDFAKRRRTMLERGLDFARATEVFASATVTFADRRQDYGEDRFNTIGFLDERMVVVTWTRRGKIHRIVSMRKANAREQKRFG
jgi:uncharacterized DUF497 family protein